MLIAEDILYYMNFKSKKSFGGWGNYGNSDIREFLTKEFLRTAFPEGGKRILAYPGAPDKISIPSKEELENPMWGLGTVESRIVKPSDFAKAHGVSGSSRFATRTRHERDKDLVYICYEDGYMNDRRVEAGDPYGVRPILWLNIEP